MQRHGASRYIQGLLNDSTRKSMQPMEARLPLNDPASYQRLQHFISHSPWSATAVWTRLRTELPVAAADVALDATEPAPSSWTSNAVSVSIPPTGSSSAWATTSRA